MGTPLGLAGALFVSIVVLFASTPHGGATLVAPPLQIVKVLSLGAARDAGATLGSTVTLAAPPPLDALFAWKKAIAGAILNPPSLPPLDPPPSAPPAVPPKEPLPPPPPEHHHHHHHRQRHVDCCCGDSSSASSADSSAASSEEDEAASREARLQRCVRIVAPNMLVDNSYVYVAQTDSCAAHGVQALASGASSVDARDTIATCMTTASFPAPLASFVQDFDSCVSRVLNAPD